MTAEDLAKWDISIIDQKLLKPASYLAVRHRYAFKERVSTRYGLGVNVGSNNGRRVLSHDGEVSGFTAQNTIFPDDRAAVVVLTNQDAADAGGAIAGAIVPLLFESADAATPVKTDQARRSSPACKKARSTESCLLTTRIFTLAILLSRILPTASVHTASRQSFDQVAQSLRGGMTLRVYIARFANGKALRIWTFEMSDGKLEQYQIASA